MRKMSVGAPSCGSGGLFSVNPAMVATCHPILPPLLSASALTHPTRGKTMAVITNVLLSLFPKRLSEIFLFWRTPQTSRGVLYHKRCVKCDVNYPLFSMNTPATLACACVCLCLHICARSRQAPSFIFIYSCSRQCGLAQ